MSNNKNFKKISSIFDNMIKKYGNSPQALGWGFHKGKQSLRFKILCDISNLSNSSILDVGCGFGDLFDYLKYNKIHVKYHGVDLNDKMIETAKNIHPRIKFESRDILEKKFSKKFDWVISSGITTFEFDYKLVKKMLFEMFRVCKNGVAMNFIGGNLDYKQKGVFYAEPEKIYAISKTLSNRISIRHDYVPYEFTLYLYKNNQKTKNHIFKHFLNTNNFILDDKKWLKSIK